MGRKAAGLYEQDGRAAEGKTFGKFGFFAWKGALMISETIGHCSLLSGRLSSPDERR
jgi:hypothetical protein